MQNLLQSTPVYGSAIGEKFPSREADLFHPTFIYDNKGSLSLTKTYAYDATHTWHSVDTYSNIGTTAVPTAFLDNIVFESKIPAIPTHTYNAITPKYTVNWADGHTINSSGSTVVAGSAVDMSSQITSISYFDGTNTTPITDWSLAPNNTNFASASGKSFTILNAANSVRINFVVPDPSDSSKTVLTGGYFTVAAISAEVDAMNKDLTATPFGQNYTATLINDSDPASPLVITTHNPNYFLIDNKVGAKKSGVLVKGSAVAYTLDNDVLSVEDHRAYPLASNSAGVVCPFDPTTAPIADALNNSWASVATYAIKAAGMFYQQDYGEALLGVDIKNMMGLSADSELFIGVSRNSSESRYTLKPFVKLINGSTTTFTDSGFSILLSARGTSSNATLDAYCAGTTSPTFISVPSELPAAYGIIATKQNFTLKSHSYWTEGETQLTSGATLTGLVNATSLHSGDFSAYGDKDIYFAEDKAGKSYAGAVKQNDKLYLVHGVPSVSAGGVLWDKEDVTTVTKEDGTKLANPDLWSNPNANLTCSLMSLSGSNLTALNVLAKESH